MKQIGFMTGCVVGTVLAGIVFLSGVVTGVIMDDWMKSGTHANKPIHYGTYYTDTPKSED